MALDFTAPTPVVYFNQFYAIRQTSLRHHEQWLNNMRQCIWDRIQFENEMIPNTDSLHHHWKRVCWVLDMWHQADLNTMVPKPLSEYGRQISKNTLNIDWDSENNMVAVRERVAGLLKGCSCKTGCETWQCGCKRNDKKCGEGCIQHKYKKKVMTSLKQA